MRRRGHNSGGFTLVEMLAVVLIIAIVVTLVVGGGSHITRQAKVKQTQVNLKIIKEAIVAYRNATGSYPGASSDSKSLFTALQNNEKSRAIIATLPTDAIKGGGFMDGFDNYIRYQPTQGAGGGPLVESAGPDLNFANVGDNIRSDD